MMSKEGLCVVEWVFHDKEWKRREENMEGNNVKEKKKCRRPSQWMEVVRYMSSALLWNLA